MDGVVAYILGKSYTKKSLIGIGALAGAPCQVQSINKVGKTTTITLKWEDNVGGVHTQAFNVEDGADGVSVTNATINTNGHLILTLSNGNSIDCGQVLPQYDTIPTPSATNEGQILQYIGTTTSSYTNGYFYICESDGVGGYRWVEKLVQDSYTKAQIGDLDNLPDDTKNVVENIGVLKLSINQLSASKLSISDIDNELSDTSENPVQNKVITLAIDQLQGSMLDALAGKEDIFRYNTLPSPSVDIENVIVQYIGVTNANYTNGYYYQCVESPVGSGTYIWTQKNVQPSGGSSGGDGVVDGYYNNTDHLFYEESTYINPVVGDSNTLYVSLDTNLLYRYNGLIFIRVDESSSGEDDVINGYYNTTDGKFYEDSTYTTEIVGQTGKIYISIDTNIQYRWDNLSLPNKFVTISSSIAVDSALSDTSENPVQNKVITVPLQALQGSVLTKMQKMLSAQQDNFAVFDNGGQVVDSNISKDIVPSDASSSNKLATKNDIETYTGSNGVDIDGNNNITLDITYLTASRVGYIPATEKGSNNGVAELDNAGKVPSSQLPSYVDDVIEGYLDSGTFYEDSAHTILITPESGKIYVDLTTNTTYRWGGSAYVQISESLALGETSTTAYRGDRGKTAYDHSQITNGTNPHNTTADNVNLKVPIPALSGSKLDVESTLYGINTALGTKADKVASAVNGHLAGLDGNGNLTDSGVVASNVIEKVTTATGLLKDDGSVDTTTYAPSANAYLVGDTAETTIDDTDYFPFYDTSATGKRKTLFSSIVNKLKNTFATLVTGTFTSGNLVSLDSSGNIADSGKSANDIVTTTDMTTAIGKSRRFQITNSDGTERYYLLSELTVSSNSFTYPYSLKGSIGRYATTDKVDFDIIADFRVGSKITGYISSSIDGTYYDIICSEDSNTKRIYLYINQIYDYADITISGQSGIVTGTITPTATMLGTAGAKLSNLAPISNKADLTDLAPAFNSASAYTIGAYVTYNGDMYRFTSAHMAGNPWSSSEVTQVTVSSELIRGIQWNTL